MGRHSAQRTSRARAQGALSEGVPDRLRDEVMQRRRKRRRITIATLLSVAILVGSIAVAGAVWIDVIRDRLGLYDDAGKRIELTALEKVEPRAPYNILILGYDRDDEGTSRSDTIILARIDEKLGKVWLISIPRDTLAEIPDYGEDKINAAYAWGGPQLAIQTVTNLTGVPIHQYIGIELEGFVGVVDAMGGIEVDVPMDITEGGGYREEAISAGPQILNGYQALWFVRTREFVDSDLTRVQNQQLFLKAVADQATRTAVTRILGVVDATSNMVETNMTLMDLAGMAKALRSIGSENMYTATIPVYIEDPYLIVLEPDFSEMMRQFMAGEPIGIEEPDAQEDGSQADDESGQWEVIPADVVVEVRNGSTRTGLAKQASTLLQSAGFGIGIVDNVVNEGFYPRTYVVYMDNRKAGELVAAHLQPGVEVRASDGAYYFDADVLIVIGNDWDLASVPVSHSY